MATYDLTQGIPSKVAAGDAINCPYTGEKAEVELPSGRYKLECWGAQGRSFEKRGTTIYTEATP